MIIFLKQLQSKYITVSTRTEGYIKIINDYEVASPVVSIDCLDFLKAFIEFPDKNDKFIGTPYPILTMQFKNVKIISICSQTTYAMYIHNNLKKTNDNKYRWTNTPDLR